MATIILTLCLSFSLSSLAILNISHYCAGFVEKCFDLCKQLFILKMGIHMGYVSVNLVNGRTLAGRNSDYKKSCYMHHYYFCYFINLNGGGINVYKP